MTHRCRLCTANDHDAVIEDLAEALWESGRHGTLDDAPWVDAGDYWQRTFRELAETSVASLNGARSYPRAGGLIESELE